MLKLVLSDWICWTTGEPNRSHYVTHTPAGHNHLATRWLMAAGGTLAHRCPRIAVFRFASDKLLDMRKYHYGGGGLQQGSRREDSVERQSEEQNGFIRSGWYWWIPGKEGQTCISAPEWTWCLPKLMMCHPHCVYLHLSDVYNLSITLSSFITYEMCSWRRNLPGPVCIWACFAAEGDNLNGWYKSWHH